MTKDLTERLKEAAAEREMILTWSWPQLCELLTEAASLIQRLEGERDEADRRAGSAERKLAYLEDAGKRETGWLLDAKTSRGYDGNISFDTVWVETCALADRAIAAEQALSASQQEVERLTSHLSWAVTELEEWDAYQKRPERGDCGVECACCMGEMFDAESRARLQEVRSALQTGGKKHG